jgi:hypothetical protein
MYEFIIIGQRYLLKYKIILFHECFFSVKPIIFGDFVISYLVTRESCYFS